MDRFPLATERLVDIFLMAAFSQDNCLPPHGLLWAKGTSWTCYDKLPFNSSMFLKARSERGMELDSTDRPIPGSV